MATLFEKLIAAGLPIASASEEGAISGVPDAIMTPEQLRIMDDIVTEHLRPVEYAIRVRVRARLEAAKLTAKNIPNWATWTQQDWTTYFNANLSDAEAELVTSLGAARVMIKRQNLVINNLVKMLIALRDQVWPDLPE